MLSSLDDNTADMPEYNHAAYSKNVNILFVVQ